MVLLILFVLVIALGLVGSRALLWTVLFLMTRQIVRNMNTTRALDPDERKVLLVVLDQVNEITGDVELSSKLVTAADAQTAANHPPFASPAD